MRLICNLILALLLLFNCGPDSKENAKVTALDEKHVLTDLLSEDVFSLEWVFGGENDTHENEYLLAQPRGIAVNDNDDILISDEYRIKIFDKDGNEKKILGGQGQGPGEFSYTPSLYVSPTGYLTVREMGRYSDVSLFAPDFSFIEKKRIENYSRIEEYLRINKFDSYNLQFIARYCVLNTTEKVYEAELRKQERGSEITVYAVILYENADSLVQLLFCKKPGKIAYSSGSAGSLSLGRIHCELLPDRRLLYINTDEDVHNEQTGSLYTFNIVSLDTFEDKKITHQFTPVEFPESSNEPGPQRINPITGKPLGESEIMKALREAMKDKKYMASVGDIKVDQNYVFVFTYLKNDSDETYTDIFDVDAGIYIMSAYFPFVPNVIKNGYAYRLTRDEEGFAEVRKYKVNPAVYGK